MPPHRNRCFELAVGHLQFHLGRRAPRRIRLAQRLGPRELANLRRLLPQTKAARLVAALRLGTLPCKDTLTQEHFDNPESVYNAFGPEMRAFDREVLAVVLLNTRFRLIKFEKLSRGTVNETLAHPREILKPAIGMRHPKL
jgi:DNA repair protein RadC